MTGGRLTSTGSSTVYADLPPKLGQKVANSSTVKEPTPSGEHSTFSSAVSILYFCFKYMSLDTTVKILTVFCISPKSDN